MATIAAFFVAYPEFQGTAEELVTAKMAEATRQLDVVQWDTLADDGIYLLTAQKLARTPFGNSAKLSTKDGTTIYDAELDELRGFVASGFRAT